MALDALWDHSSRSKRAAVEALEVKLRDFLIVVCLVAVMALFFKNLNDTAPHTAQTNEVVVTPPLTGTPTPESVDVPAPTKSNPKERTVNTGFRIKRITASVLADNTSDDEMTAIAGFVHTEALDGSQMPKFSPGLLEQGESVFLKDCAICHGEEADGKGDGWLHNQDLVPKLDLRNSQKYAHGASATQIFLTTKYGVENTGMTPFKSSLSDEDIAAVSYYVFSIQADRK